MNTSRPRSHVRLLEPAELAELMHVDLGTVARWTGGPELTPVDGLGRPRRFAWDEVMRLIVGAKRTKESVATRVPRSLAPHERDRDVAIAEAALDVDLVVAADVRSAAPPHRRGCHHRPHRTRCHRPRGRAGDCRRGRPGRRRCRYRADSLAGRVRKAPERAVVAEPAAPGSGDVSALERAARTASIVESAAAAVVAETAELAATVARTVAVGEVIAPPVDSIDPPI